jgi:hypothetical protein
MSIINVVYFLPEDQEEFDIAMRGSKFQSAMYSFYELYLHKKVKHGIDENNKPYSNEEMVLLEEIQNKFFECMGEYGLEWEDLYK